MALFQQRKFEIVRKAPEQVLAMRRIVFDNDHQPRDLRQAKKPPRWAPERAATDAPEPAAANYKVRRELGRKQGAWMDDGDHDFRHPARAGELAWLRYRHLVVEPSRDKRTNLAARQKKPSLITDFWATTRTNCWGGIGKNASELVDLPLECEVHLDSIATRLAIRGVSPEPPRAPTRPRRRSVGTLELDDGVCSLVRITATGEVLDSQPTAAAARDL